jgi:hypothetical protein
VSDLERLFATAVEAAGRVNYERERYAATLLSVVALDPAIAQRMVKRAENSLASAESDLRRARAAWEARQ